MALTERRQKQREEELEKVRKFESSPWVFLIRKNRLTYLIVTFLLIFGLVTIGTIPKEINPEVEIPIAVVSTFYPGASPLDVEKQITDEVEAAIGDLNGIKKIDSTSSREVSSVVVEFEADQDLTESIRKLRDEVEGMKNELPEDAFDPQVIEISIDDEAIFNAVLTGERYDVADLKKFAEDLKDKMERIPYVSEVKVIGGQDRVVKIDIDGEKATQRGLSVNSVLGVLNANNVDFPAGTIEINESIYTVRTEAELVKTSEIARLPVGRNGGTTVYLEDVAKVEDGFAKETSRSRFALGGQEPSAAVSIQLFKKTGGDVTQVADLARAVIEDGKGKIYPEDVSAEVIIDFADYITESIRTLSGNGMGTVVIILLLLFFFLGLREALIAGLSVPFSFFVSFIVMSMAGQSLNFLTLFSLVLALGLLVDSAIVVVEGMYTKIARWRLSGYQSAIGTIREFAAPLLSGMLTTVAAFVPLLFVKGIMGEFIRVIPAVVSSTLIAALFVSLTIVPALGALAMNPKKKLKKEKEECDWRKMGIFSWAVASIKWSCRPRPRSERIANRFFRFVSGKYRNVIPTIVGEKKHRRLLIGGAWLLFVLAMALPSAGFLKIKAFGQVDSDFMYINIETPAGWTLEKTDGAVRKAEQIVREETSVADYTSSVGSSFSADSGSSSGRTNRAFIFVNLIDEKEREEKSWEIIAQMRERFDREITEAKFGFVEEQSGPPGGAPIELRVVGDDLNTLDEVAEDIKVELEKIPTVVNAETSVRFSPGEFVFVPNKDVLSSKGLSVISVASEINKGITRDRDVEITRGGETIKLDVGFDEKRLTSANDLESILIMTPLGEKMAISELGKVEIRPGISSISHRDEERVVSVSAQTEGGNATEITQELMGKVEKMDIPAGYRIDFGGEQDELTEVYQDMLAKMVIGIILILLILIIQFNSYKQVSIILFTIPLAMIGVFFGMAVARLPLDIPAFIGIVSLVGIVVNNAIILIDRINKELAKGKDLVRSVSRAGYLRLRPILLTSITTIMGLLPLSITQADWRNMGFAIIFGLAFSTLLTLFVIPTMFVSFYRRKYGVE